MFGFGKSFEQEQLETIKKLHGEVKHLLHEARLSLEGVEEELNRRHINFDTVTNGVIELGEKLDAETARADANDKTITRILQHYLSDEEMKLVHLLDRLPPARTHTHVRAPAPAGEPAPPPTDPAETIRLLREILQDCATVISENVEKIKAEELESTWLPGPPPPSEITLRDQKRLDEILLSPIEPNARMRRAARAFKQFKGNKRVKLSALLADIDAALADETPFVVPAIGSKWRHDNGIEYIVTDHTNMDSDRPEYPPTISYQGLANGKKWSRALKEWHRSFTKLDPE